MPAGYLFFIKVEKITLSLSQLSSWYYFVSNAIQTNINSSGFTNLQFKWLVVKRSHEKQAKIFSDTAILSFCSRCFFDNRLPGPIFKWDVP